MELIEKIQTLKKEGKFNKEELLQITSAEDLFFIVNEAFLTAPKDYNNLFSVFDYIRQIAEDSNGLNIFSENLTIKFYYFNYLYKIDTEILDALLEILGPVYLDYELERRFLQDDEFTQYYFKRYREFKQDSELSLYKLLQKFDVKGLQIEGEDLEKQIVKLRETLGI